MPPLSRRANPETVECGSGAAPVLADADVLVVGGGPSGLGAAIGAASAGSRVVLAERYGFLGGSATAAMVIPMASAYTCASLSARSIEGVTLFPRDHGEGEPVIAGVFHMLLERLVSAGGATRPGPQTGYTVPFDAEVFKLVAMKLLDEAGVSFLLHVSASAALVDRAVRGAVFHSKSGPVAIRARVTVDCTGDADISALAGAAYEVGRAGDGLVQPMTLLFKMAGFERDRFEKYIAEHPGQWSGVQGLQQLVAKARRDGRLDLKRENMLFFGTTRTGEVIMNSTRVGKVFGTDVLDLTYAEWESRRQMEQIAAFLRRYVPGFENAYIAQSGAEIGVRETRRVVGKYKLTERDVVEARKFDDVIARGTYPIDIHNPTGPGTVLKRVSPCEAYDIPLRCLLPLDVKGLVVAGRCISGTHEAQSSYRTVPICMATGHAAGVCAALAAGQGIPPDSVAAADVQSELLRQGANLGRISGNRRDTGA